MKLLVHAKSTRDSDQVARAVSKSYVKFRGVSVDLDPPTPGNSSIQLQDKTATNPNRRKSALMTKPSTFTDSNPSITELSQLEPDGFMTKLEVARQGWRKSLSGRERPRGESVASTVTRMSAQSQQLNDASLDESLEIADQILGSANLEQDVPPQEGQEGRKRIASRIPKGGPSDPLPLGHSRTSSDGMSASNAKRLKLANDGLLEVRSASLPLPTNAPHAERQLSTLRAVVSSPIETGTLIGLRSEVKKDGVDFAHLNSSPTSIDDVLKVGKSLPSNKSTKFSLQEFPHMISHETAAIDTVEPTDDPSSMTRWLSKLAEHYIQREKSGKLVNLGGVAVIKTCFATRTRDINRWERGCWRWDTKDWPLNHQRTVMKRVKEHIGNGHYGSSTYCKLRCGPDESIHTHAMGTTQVWCFGEQAPSVFIGLLITTQSEHLPTYNLQWVDADGVVIMDGPSRVLS